MPTTFLASEAHAGSILNTEPIEVSVTGYTEVRQTKVCTQRVIQGYVLDLPHVIAVHAQLTHRLHVDHILRPQVRLVKCPRERSHEQWIVILHATRGFLFFNIILIFLYSQSGIRWAHPSMVPWYHGIGLLSLRTMVSW